MIYFLTFAVILAADIFTKNLITATFTLGEVREIVPNFFNLTLVYNPGAAFGLFSDLEPETRRITLAVVTIIALGVIIRLAIKDVKDDKVSLVALSGIFAGAIGNVIDRFRYDAVVDFLDFYIGTNHWPAFNVADSAISIGVCIIIFQMIFNEQKSDELQPDTSNSEEKSE